MNGLLMMKDTAVHTGLAVNIHCKRLHKIVHNNILPNIH